MKLLRIWNPHQRFLHLDQSGKVWGTIWVESNVYVIVNIQWDRDCGASGSQDFACCHRLGCHLATTCIQDVALDSLDNMMFFNNDVTFMQRRNTCCTLILWKEASLGAWEKVWSRRFFFLNILWKFFYNIKTS